jgi:phosphoenolpyruvate synthase/pyruvate phosphate dikinase
MPRPLLNALPPDAAESVALLWLGDRRAADPARAGGKAASLSRPAAGHRVPPGFVVALPGATLDRAARAAVVAAFLQCRPITTLSNLRSST